MFSNPSGNAVTSARDRYRTCAELFLLCSRVCADTATLQAAEAPHFSPAARLRTFVLPKSGHSVNPARNTADYQAAMLEWMESIAG